MLRLDRIKSLKICTQIVCLHVEFDLLTMVDDRTITSASERFSGL